MSSAATRRIGKVCLFVACLCTRVTNDAKELSDLENDPVPNVKAGPESDDNLLKFASFLAPAACLMVWTDGRAL
jgi:hypothetical protein